MLAVEELDLSPRPTKNSNTAIPSQIFQLLEAQDFSLLSVAEASDWII
jgi:hypothetical protein